MERIGLEPGTEIGGYRIVNQLGSGAMGVVYRALDGGGQPVAFKMLRSSVIDAEELRVRLIREATAMRKIDHPAVAAMLDVETDSDETFIVTELIDGPTLETYVADHGPLEAEELHAFAARLYDALSAVHGAHVVHRDMKPNNVLMSSKGPVLIDFGIAHGMQDPRLTATGLVVGTPGYLAPELINGLAPSAATDLWGWAAVVVFAATGRPPFGIGSFETVFGRAMAGRADVDGLDERVAVALRGALAVKAEYRWHPVEVLEELRDAAENPDASEPFHEPDEGTWNATQIVEYQGLGAGLPDTDATRVAPRLMQPGGDPATQVLDAAGSTRVMPAAQGAQDWNQTQVLAPVPGPPSYQPDPYGAPQSQDVGGWDPLGPFEMGELEPEDEGYRRPEPPTRSLIMTLGLFAVAAAAMLVPAYAGVVLVAVLIVFRTVGVAWDSFHERREYKGISKRDGLRAGFAVPWNFVRAFVGLIPSLLIAAGTFIVVGGVLLWTVQGAASINNPRNELLATQGVVAVAALAAILMVWFGPVTHHTRVGGRVTVQALFPGKVATLIVALLLLAVITLVALQLAMGAETLWAPLQEPPSFHA